MTSDPKDSESTQGNGHDDSLTNEDVEQEYVADEILEERHATDNGHEEEPVIEKKDGEGED